MLQLLGALSFFVKFYVYTRNFVVFKSFPVLNRLMLLELVMDSFKYTLINYGIKLKEYPDGLLFGTDALLLSEFANGSGLPSNSRRIGLDLGTGSGVIPLLMLASGGAKQITGLELQERYASLAKENSEANGFSERFSSICGDIRNVRNDSRIESESFDFVTSNPPYLKSEGCGKMNISESKRIARHEDSCNADELCAAAAYALKYGGLFYVVYRPERLCVILAALANHRLEPKRMVFAGTNPEKPSLVLIEAKKGGSEGLKVSFEKIV